MKNKAITKTLSQIQLEINKNITVTNEQAKTFFKTGKGHYAEHDQFIGITVPNLRKISKHFAKASLPVIQSLLASKINEERLLALFILIGQYKKAEKPLQETLYQFYLKNLQYINNWNLVDASAHLIIGAHLWDKNRAILGKLAKSNILWERRIAIVSTWYFIKRDDLKWTLKISRYLLQDDQDLIHKAVGWMLRELGKRNEVELIDFLTNCAEVMPRTMLRYAIEKFPEAVRKKYLSSNTTQSKNISRSKSFYKNNL
jgi:3-methyladenine DNA glycosylase AlkD